MQDKKILEIFENIDRVKEAFVKHYVTTDRAFDPDGNLICPECWWRVNKEDKFCRGCGKRFPPADK